MKRRRSRSDRQISLTFKYAELLRAIVRDLDNLDRLIPAEVSRHGCLFSSQTQGEEMALVEGRKNDLLRYVQTVCRDHVRWGNKLLEKGWRANGGGQA